jgi:ABC-2 type transport system permease protein
VSDYLGEKKMNNILKTYIDQVAFQEPPYTTSVEFVNLLKFQTPDSLQYLIKDMFETITLYDNQALKATYEVLENGQYEVNFDVNIQKYRSSEKGEKEFSDAEGEGLVLETDGENLESLLLKDYIEVGVFGESDESLDDVRKETVLYLKKHMISEINTTFSIVVDKKPLEAGIDPFNKLIDTDSDDNRIEVKEK